MSENYIVINGNKIELTEEQLKQLGIEPEKKDPFKRVNKCKKYYFITSRGVVLNYIENNDAIDEELYNIINYFNDEAFAEQVALHQLLYRKLLKFSYDNECEDVEWNNRNGHWYIFYSHADDLFSCKCNDSFKSQSVYFSSSDAANRAIKEVVEPFVKEHPDFIW